MRPHRAALNRAAPSPAALVQLRYLVGWEAAATSFAENYVGPPLI